MIADFFRWLAPIFEQNVPDFWAWKLYAFPPGHHPLIFWTEATVQPKGLWWTYKVPVSYYSNNTVFYHWPVALDVWINWFRNFNFSTHTSDVFSYKKIHAVLLVHSPYWCNFSLWDLISYTFTGSPNLGLFLSMFNQISLFESFPCELNIVYKPYYFDTSWTDWFLKIENLNHSERYGVCLNQLNFTTFVQYFLLGYWCACIKEMPWAWRMRYPAEVSNWRWLKMYRSFFKNFNLMSPVFLGVTLFLVIAGSVHSKITAYILWVLPFRELAFCNISLWLNFLCVSLVICIPLARLSKILYSFISRKNNNLGILADFVCFFVPLSRSKVLRGFINIWHSWSFCVCLFLLYALIPLLGYLPVFCLKVFGVLTKIIFLGVAKVWSFVYFYLLGSVTKVLNFFDWDNSLLGDLFGNESLWGFIYSFYPWYDYLCFQVRWIPLVIIGFFLYIGLIFWPLLSPRLERFLIRMFPWAFVKEISVKTRVKYGCHLLYLFLKNKFR